MGMGASLLSSSSKGAALVEAESGVRSFGTCAKRYYNRNKMDWAASLLKNGAKIGASAAGGAHGVVTWISLKVVNSLFSIAAHQAMKYYREAMSGGMDRGHVFQSGFEWYIMDEENRSTFNNDLLCTVNAGIYNEIFHAVTDIEYANVSLKDLNKTDLKSCNDVVKTANQLAISFYQDYQLKDFLIALDFYSELIDDGVEEMAKHFNPPIFLTGIGTQSNESVKRKEQYEIMYQASNDPAVYGGKLGRSIFFKKTYEDSVNRWIKKDTLDPIMQRELTSFFASKKGFFDSFNRGDHSSGTAGFFNRTFGKTQKQIDTKASDAITKAGGGAQAARNAEAIDRHNNKVFGDGTKANAGHAGHEGHEGVYDDAENRGVNNSAQAGQTVQADANKAYSLGTKISKSGADGITDFLKDFAIDFAIDFVIDAGLEFFKESIWKVILAKYKLAKNDKLVDFNMLFNISEMEQFRKHAKKTCAVMGEKFDHLYVAWVEVKKNPVRVYYSQRDSAYLVIYFRFCKLLEQVASLNYVFKMFADVLQKRVSKQMELSNEINDKYEFFEIDNNQHRISIKNSEKIAKLLEASHNHFTFSRNCSNSSNAIQCQL